MLSSLHPLRMLFVEYFRDTENCRERYVKEGVGVLFLSTADCHLAGQPTLQEQADSDSSETGSVKRELRPGQRGLANTAVWKGTVTGPNHFQQCSAIPAKAEHTWAPYPCNSMPGNLRSRTANIQVPKLCKRMFRAARTDLTCSMKNMDAKGTRWTSACTGRSGADRTNPRGTSPQGKSG